TAFFNRQVDPVKRGVEFAQSRINQSKVISRNAAFLFFLFNFKRDFPRFFRLSVSSQRQAERKFVETQLLADFDGAAASSDRFVKKSERRTNPAQPLLCKIIVGSKFERTARFFVSLLITPCVVKAKTEH